MMLWAVDSLFLSSVSIFLYMVARLSARLHDSGKGSRYANQFYPHTLEGFDNCEVIPNGQGPIN